jgi:hypothetical protein
MQHVVSSGELALSDPGGLTQQVRLERIEELLETLVVSFSEAVGEPVPGSAGPAAVKGEEEEEEEEKEKQEKEEKEEEEEAEEEGAKSETSKADSKKELNGK